MDTWGVVRKAYANSNLNAVRICIFTRGEMVTSVAQVVNRVAHAVGDIFSGE